MKEEDTKSFRIEEQGEEKEAGLSNKRSGESIFK